jgi:Kef-type K+ transport system membrane component KefB
MNPYITILAFSAVIILSFLFNQISKRTNIPSVLMLIGLGMGIKAVLQNYGLVDKVFGLNTILEILGNIGIVMIVLEASLDLELHREKAGMMVRAFIVAAVSFTAIMFAIGFLFNHLFPESNLYTCLVYAVPLSIMSSSIIIPSIGALSPEKKEFMVYESTFSDIIGIMVFYFMLGAEGVSDGSTVAFGVLVNIVLTILLSVFAAFAIVIAMKRLTMEVKLFLIVALLLFLYSLGKMFHLSSLLLILAFGLVLNNTHIFFRKNLRRFIDRRQIAEILADFHKLTLESAFLIRTFFFVIFGFSISFASLYSWDIARNSLIIVAIFYALRFVFLRIIAPGNVLPELWIAPRGLITILLYFSIQKSKGFSIPAFDTGLLLYPVLITSMIMTIGLLTYRGKKVTDALLSQLPRIKQIKPENEDN